MRMCVVRQHAPSSLPSATLGLQSRYQANLLVKLCRGECGFAVTGGEPYNFLLIPGIRPKNQSPAVEFQHESGAPSSGVWQSPEGRRDRGMGGRSRQPARVLEGTITARTVATGRSAGKECSTSSATDLPYRVPASGDRPRPSEANGYHSARHEHRVASDTGDAHKDLDGRWMTIVAAKVEVPPGQSPRRLRGEQLRLKGLADLTVRCVTRGRR